jgi:hypothetical protein
MGTVGLSVLEVILVTAAPSLLRESGREPDSLRPRVDLRVVGGLLAGVFAAIVAVPLVLSIVMLVEALLDYLIP